MTATLRPATAADAAACAAIYAPFVTHGWVSFELSEPLAAIRYFAGISRFYPNAWLTTLWPSIAGAPWPEGDFDVVAMIDVIHHVSRPEQEAVIRRACRKVRRGGLFLYKDMVERPWWRAAANRLHDLVLARQWIHYVPVKEVERWAEDEGLVLDRSELINRWWYGHELRVFRKPLPAVS